MSKTIMTLCVSALALCGCVTDSAEERFRNQVFDNVAVPESSLLTRAAYFSEILNKQNAGKETRCLVDATFPEIRVRGFSDSAGIHREIKEKVRGMLLADMSRTNSAGDGLPWGWAEYPLPALSGSGITGGTLSVILFKEVVWRVDYRTGWVVVRLFPERVDIIEYRLKPCSPPHRYWQLDDFMIYDNYNRQAVIRHPSAPDRVFVAAPPEIHEKALALLDERRSSWDDPDSFPDAAPAPRQW